MLKYIVVAISLFALVAAYYSKHKTTPTTICIDIVVIVVTIINTIVHAFSFEWLDTICFGVSALNWILAVIFEIKRNIEIDKKFEDDFIAMIEKHEEELRKLEENSDNDANQDDVTVEDKNDSSNNV